MVGDDRPYERRHRSVVHVTPATADSEADTVDRGAPMSVLWLDVAEGNRVARVQQRGPVAAADADGSRRARVRAHVDGVGGDPDREAVPAVAQGHGERAELGRPGR